MSDDDLIPRVRKKLVSDKVRLWLPPYTFEDGRKGQDPEELQKKYSIELEQPVEVIARVMEDLRLRAVNKLAARRREESSGQNVSLRVTLAESSGQKREATTVEVLLEDMTSSLRDRIAGYFHVPANQLKLISASKMLDIRLSLAAQGIRDGGQVLAVLLSPEDVESAQKEEEKRNAADNLVKTRQAAEILARREDDDDRYSLMITDQSGREIPLPPSERKALATAMALHEKGRALVKRKNYVEALLVLTEADQHFKQCRTDILQAVDNYAILCLDVVWCYWCLKNLDHLPDADARLTICRSSLERSHGFNMERLMLLKGSTGMELVLYVRMYFLQAVTAYHQQRIDVARALLAKAESIAGSLQVDEDKLAEVVSVGFSTGEARLALRAHEGNVAVAVAYLMDKREEKKRRLEDEKKEQKKRSREKRFGKTADGSRVKVEVVDVLMGMGYSEQTAAEALKQANNDINLALQVILENPHLLQLPDIQDEDFRVSDELLAEVTSMGFDPQIAMAALKHHHGSVQKCLDDLLAGWLPPPTSSHQSDTESARQREEEKEVVASLVLDLQNEEDDYLDVSLDEEISAIQEYRVLIDSQLPSP